MYLETIHCYYVIILFSLQTLLKVISLQPDPLGITEINDLGESDLEKVRCLAHIELSVTFEENNIPLRPLKAKKVSKINGKDKSCIVLMDVL